MMRLRDKLANLPSPASADVRPSGLFRSSSVRMPPSHGAPWDMEETDSGFLGVVRNRFSDPYRYGRVRVAEAREVSVQIARSIALDESLPNEALERMLLLDTETTGLGGAGTFAFVTGLGWFEGSDLCLEQWVVTDPGQEAAMLKRLGDAMREASCLVTYNGRAYDWPLLRSRFVMHRLAIGKAPPHVDLLPCARRVLRHRLEAVRLADVEAGCLGAPREDDIGGAEIPARYFEYLRGGEAGLLEPVLTHNARDLLALAALLAQLAQGFESPRGTDDGRDHVGYAQVAARAGDVDRAIEFARLAMHRGERSPAVVRALLLASRTAVRRSRVGDAEALLREALEMAGDLSPSGSAQLHLAAAKLYEHRRQAFSKALVHAQHTALAEGEGAQSHRIARLKRKSYRTATQRQRSAEGIATPCGRQAAST